jgi:hypothetical protein
MRLPAYSATPHFNETLQVPTMPVPPEQAPRSFVDAATGGTGGDTMRLTLIGTAVAALTTATLLAAPANADRYCRKVCDNGFCRSSCVESRDRLYMYDRGDYRDRLTITGGMVLTSTVPGSGLKSTANN